jgi:predicted DNA-binding protein
LAKKTLIDEIIEDYNQEIEDDLIALDLKKSFRDQLVTKRNEKKKKEATFDDGNSEEVTVG